MYLLFFLIIHLALRFKGKNISTRWFILEMFFSGIFGFIGYMERADISIFSKLSFIGSNLLLAASIGCVTVIVYDSIKYKTQFHVLLKKVSLIVSILLLVVVPYIFYYFSLFSAVPSLKIFLVVSYILFPVLFIYGTFRYSLIPEQLFFSSSILTLYLTLMSTGAYFSYLSFFKFLAPSMYDKYKLHINIFFIILLLSTLSKIKHQTSRLLD